MGIVDKKVLVIGLGLSGISTIKTLSSLKAEVYCYDDKEKSELQRVFEELKNFNYKFIKIIKIMILIL
ncbi:alanine dehydrogenase/pyridine nucleotide transhydrogenase domain protein [Parvimonas sp. oral taxon 393 str. F0440]|nr:alanine dehydrogenase/pyridine nucleotide transhydrogenase domain protein [Parvimonas sp. oral taxon 393 str. F0440]